ADVAIADDCGGSEGAGGVVAGAAAAAGADAEPAAVVGEAGRIGLIVRHADLAAGGGDVALRVGDIEEHGVGPAVAVAHALGTQVGAVRAGDHDVVAGIAVTEPAAG